jgi:ABC-type multidrug transport system ATPase subunit
MSAGRAAVVLKAMGVSREYDGFVALAPLELSIDAGESVALIGPNGAGKTTFLSLAAGLLEAGRGGLAVSRAPAGSIEARRAVSYLPDQPVFYDDLSLDEHLEYVAALHGADGTVKGSELLERLGLGAWGGHLPGELSRGMRQKASIALALVRPFSLLLADEPFDGLDPPSRDVLFELLAESRAAGAATIVSTHRRDVIEAADRCVGLRDGELAYDGPPAAGEVADFFSSPDAGASPTSA